MGGNGDITGLGNCGGRRAKAALRLHERLRGLTHVRDRPHEAHHSGAELLLLGRQSRTRSGDVHRLVGLMGQHDRVAVLAAGLIDASRSARFGDHDRRLVVVGHVRGDPFGRNAVVCGIATGDRVADHAAVAEQIVAHHGWSLALDVERVAAQATGEHGGEVLVGA